MTDNSTLLVPPTVRHCPLDLEQIFSRLHQKGKSAFCCAFEDYLDIAAALIRMFEKAEYKIELRARRLITHEAPIIVLYDANRTELTIREAKAEADPILKACDGCWLRDAS